VPQSELLSLLEHVEKKVWPIDAIIRDGASTVQELVRPNDGLAVREIDGGSLQHGLETEVLVGQRERIGITEVDVHAMIEIGGRETYDLERRLGGRTRRDRNAEARYDGQLCFGLPRSCCSSQLRRGPISRGCGAKLPAGYSTRGLNQVAQRSVLPRRTGAVSDWRSYDLVPG
jgi:hypothetical protein